VIPQQELDSGLNTLKIMWFAMLGSLAVYLFVALLTGADWRPALSEERFAMLRAVIYPISLANLFLARYLKKRVQTAKGRPKSLPSAFGHSPLLGLIFAMSGKGRARSSPVVFEHPVLQKYVSATILALAMYESIGIYGLVLFLLGKSTVDLYLLILVSAAAMVFNKPKRDEVITLCEAWENDPANNTPSS